MANIEDSYGQLPQISAGLTLTERVYLTLKEAILNLQLKPGSPLVEDELAHRLGTSKTPVRDALLALERDGLVTKIPYKGTYVADISLKDAREIFELRAVLEGLSARLAVDSFTLDDLNHAEHLLNAADEARARGDYQAASSYGAEFHEVIHRHAENSRLVPILRNLENQLRRLRLVSDRGEGRLDRSAHQHRQVLAALRAGDHDQAEQCMRRHLESVLDDFALVEDESSAPVAPRPSVAEAGSL